MIQSFNKIANKLTFIFKKSLTRFTKSPFLVNVIKIIKIGSDNGDNKIIKRLLSYKKLTNIVINYLTFDARVAFILLKKVFIKNLIN